MNISKEEIAQLWEVLDSWHESAQDECMMDQDVVQERWDDICGTMSKIEESIE